MHAETPPLALRPLKAILELNTALFENALEGVDDATARRRPKEANNIAFLALHLLDARAYMAGYLGHPVEYPQKESLKEARGADDLSEYPPLSSVLESWRKVSREVSGLFDEVSPEKLAEDSDVDFPISRGDRLGGIAFLLNHESHHIGQLAYLRRLFDLPAMKWG